MWHQPCQRYKYTTSVDIQKRAIKKTIHSCRITCERSESDRYIKAINNNIFCYDNDDDDEVNAYWGDHLPYF